MTTPEPLTPEEGEKSPDYNRGWADGQASALDACQPVIDSLQATIDALRTPTPAGPGLREALDAMERDIRFLVGDVDDIWVTWARVRAALATTPESGEHCQSCARAYPLGGWWHAPDDLWERVTGESRGGGLRCPDCFGREAEAKGITLVWSVVDAATPDTLDASWAEAEAALPKGWGIALSSDADSPDRYRAHAGRVAFQWPPRIVGPEYKPTPAAALRALAARLREDRS